MPTALKVFFWSLICGLLGGFAAFKVALFIALKLIEGDNAELFAHMIAMLAAVTFGICSAITAGVMAGRATKI